MAIPTNIKTLLSGDVVEWARIEFKETWDPAASLKTVCAFANDLDNWGGGYIVIGVEEDNGRPVYPLKGVPVDKIDVYQKSIFQNVNLLDLHTCLLSKWLIIRTGSLLFFGVPAVKRVHIHHPKQ